MTHASMKWSVLALLLMVYPACQCAPEIESEPAPSPGVQPSTSSTKQKSLPPIPQRRQREVPTCPSELPEVVPKDLLVRIVQTRIPRGKPPKSTRLEFVRDRKQCKKGNCTVFNQAQSSDLWRAIRASGFQKMKSQNETSSPHRGSRFLTVSWANHRCAIGQDSRNALNPQDAQKMSALFRRIHTLNRAAIGPRKSP